MSKCRAGDCDVECGGAKGCGCIAESDNPENCSCFCSGSDIVQDVKFEASVLVDLTINELPLFEVAGFLSAVSAQRIMMSTDKSNRPITSKMSRKTFAEALKQLGLESIPSQPKGKSNVSLLLLTLLAVFLTGALTFGMLP